MFDKSLELPGYTDTVENINKDGRTSETVVIDMYATEEEKQRYKTLKAEALMSNLDTWGLKPAVKDPLSSKNRSSKRLWKITKYMLLVFFTLAFAFMISIVFYDDSYVSERETFPVVANYVGFHKNQPKFERPFDIFPSILPDGK